MAEKIEKRMEDVCERMLFAARSELYLHMRFLDVALSMFSYALEPNIETIGCDGRIIYYNPAYLGGIYRQTRINVNRAYLHMVFHCIFAHPWKDTRIRKKRAAYELGIIRNPKEEDLTDLLWDISCDIAVEHMIDERYLHCIRKPLSAFRKDTYKWLKKEKNVLNAESIFSALVEKKIEETEARRLKQEFEVDEHRIWRERNRQNQKQNPKEDWDDVREKMQTELESFGEEKDTGASQSMLEEIKAENRERHNYREFLKKFAVLKEEQQIDADSFDYGFYSYGLSLYGNMPLIEPLETKEVKKVEEFIIAIDTSMSCSGELVKQFLEETWAILRETDSFFHKVNIHIIQCDEQVRKDDKITSKEELEGYMKHLEIEGKGGTDFVPVFTYVQELLRKKEFSNLRGLLYFTDGKGRFPKKMPPYQTAFVLIQKEFEEIEVPPWAIRIYQTEEEGYGLGEKEDEY